MLGIEGADPLDPSDKPKPPKIAPNVSFQNEEAAAHLLHTPISDMELTSSIE
jgi:hypothetical protein